MNYGGMFYPYDNQLNKTTDINQRPSATRLAVESLQEAGLVKKAQMKQFSAEPFIALPEFAERAEGMIGSRDKLMADIMINTRDELQSFINACSVLNCANVIVDTITPAGSKTPRFIRGK